MKPFSNSSKPFEQCTIEFSNETRTEKTVISCFHMKTATKDELKKYFIIFFKLVQVEMIWQTYLFFTYFKNLKTHSSGYVFKVWVKTLRHNKISSLTLWERTFFFCSHWSKTAGASWKDVTVVYQTKNGFPRINAFKWSLPLFMKSESQQSSSWAFLRPPFWTVMFRTWMKLKNISYSVSY